MEKTEVINQVKTELFRSVYSTKLLIYNSKDDKNKMYVNIFINQNIHLNARMLAKKQYCSQYKLIAAKKEKMHEIGLLRAFACI